MLKPVKWGIIGGLNVTYIRGNDLDYVFSNGQTILRTGYHAAIFVRTHLSKKWMLSHELAFGQRNLGVTPKDSLFED
ncbi:hypothetical protein [Dyadobacter sp. 3J3]|uniref:hypothetical protein n=1 Tax=Dyadobacter sp. 3J3 TaxID=2606600 RepID=UPI00135A8B73|nr:hypothetical protein [Dyadobacter sp. 3J3]